jgi:hypothetical protein
MKLFNEQNLPTDNKPISYNLNLLLIVLLAVTLGIFSCEGPVGPEGPPGPPGPSGAVGPAGSDGNLMHAGEGSPESDLGEEGDFYLDLATGNLYGPKDSQGWGEAISLSGEDGKDGSQIHAGDGPPEAELGDEGDYYLDKENYHLYGPKSGDGWGDPIHLQGPEGAAGTDGVSGWIRVVENETIDPESNLTVTAICPAGKVPLGGGYNASSSLVIVFKSHPTTDRWIVTGRNTSAAIKQGLTAYAICANVN